MAKSIRHNDEMFKEYVRKGYWEATTLSDYWDRNARDYPDDEAIVDSQTRLTWGEAKKWIDRLALGFLGLGFKKDDMIVVQLPNCVELGLLRIACERAGLLCLPVLRTWRHNEMEYTLERVEAAGVVIPWMSREFDYFAMIEQIQPRLSRLKTIFVTGERVPDGALSLKEMVKRHIEQEYPAGYLEKTKCPAEEFSLVAQTSGSAGFPKFVESPLACRIYEGKVFAERFNITEEDIIGVFSPATGGPNIPAYFSAPRVRAKVVMLEHFSAQEAFELIEKEKITLAAVVPTMLAMMMQDYRAGRYNSDSLRCIYCAGSLLPPELGKEVQDKFGCKIVQVYGTMDAGGITVHSLSDPDSVRLTTVGKPGPGNEIRLVDDLGKEGPEVEVGEILVKGPMLVTGYHKDAEATKSVWTDDGWYQTGDLGKFDKDGNLVIVGRKKEMIIRGGQNIYPGEIENLLMTHPDISQVAVVKMPDLVMGERACAYIVSEKERDFTLEEIITFLQKKGVAAYKIPERMERIASLPLLGSGKVDKKLLEKDVAEKLARIKS